MVKISAKPLSHLHLTLMCELAVSKSVSHIRFSAHLPNDEKTKTLFFEG